jgi:acetolactate synthase-1/2/3 large subunit
MTIAKGFGMTAYDLDAASDPYSTLARALSEPGPCLIHAAIDAQEKVYPMVPPGAANTDMIEGEVYANAHA